MSEPAASASGAEIGWRQAPSHARCADFRRYLSADLDRLTIASLNRGDVWTAKAGGRVRRLDWDSEFFGVPAGRLELLWRDPAAPAREAWEALVPALLRRADDMGLVFLDARIDAEELALAQALEAGGFRLVDALSIYLRDLRGVSPLLPQPGVLDVEAFLRTALRDMQWGRLFAEPHVAREQAEDFYLKTSLHHLARGALSAAVHENRELAGVAIGVPEAEGSRLAGRSLGHLWLFIVAPGYKGRGVGKRLFNQFCAEFATIVDVVEIGTQIQHAAANRIYRGAGGLPVAHALTFHRWPSQADTSQADTSRPA
ncbi:MAG: GNAT family N-acetyltransferase [Alphaproteobacteria bacterium]|nr:GNAT family N-acetyltransferase [Alphaproteobacteria bacterium]